jgi:hypothetical protein
MYPSPRVTRLSRYRGPAHLRRRLLRGNLWRRSPAEYRLFGLKHAVFAIRVTTPLSHFFGAPERAFEPLGGGGGGGRLPPINDFVTDFGGAF